MGQAGDGYYKGEVVGVVDAYDCSITAKWEVTRKSKVKSNFIFTVYLDDCNNPFYSNTYLAVTTSGKGENKFSNVKNSGCYRFYLIEPTGYKTNYFAVSEKINYPGC